MKKIILIIVLIIIALGAYFIFRDLKNREESKANNNSNNQIMNGEQNVYEIQGIRVEVLKQGSGAEAKNGDTVSVHYVGTFEDGGKFDSSIDRGQPFSFMLGAGKVIQGWDLGVLGMKVGEKRRLTIPPQLAYGAEGFPGAIPPNATLLFEVELLAISD